MAQVQKWWELSGAGGGQKQQIQPMAAGYAGKVEVLNDTTRVAILNMHGEALLEKAIAHLVSGVQTADGLDSLGNAYLWLSYTQNLGSGNMLVLEKLSSVDSIVYTPQYLNDNMASSEPLKLICNGQEAILLTAVYLPDSTSFLRWLKFDAYTGLLTDSFLTSNLTNTVFSYAETFGNKAIVHGSTPAGKKNWLLDFSNASIQEWQWNFGNIALVGNETTTFTKQEDIFSVIHTFTDSTQIDALLTLCDTSFAPKWMIRYNSEYNLNDSIVDLAFYQDKIYIAGYVQKDSVNKDYLIASMNHDGTMNWELKYDGPGMESIDLGVSLCVDEVGDVFFTGHSSDNGQSRVFSIQLNEYGNVLWESDFAEAIQRRATEILTRDGSVYLTGQNLSNSVNNFVILYKDSLKIESIQKMHLKMLATGFSVIQEDSTLKSLVWDKFSRQYSFRRTVSFSSMERFLRSKGKDLYRLMNAKINRDFKLDRASPTVELILASLKSRKETPFIHFPFLDSLRQEEFVESRETIFAYSQSWPESLDDVLPCVYCDEPVRWPGELEIIVITLDPLIDLPSFPKVLYGCLYEKKENKCLFCDEINHLGLQDPVSSMHLEIGIELGSQADWYCDIRTYAGDEDVFFNSIRPEEFQNSAEYPGYIDQYSGVLNPLPSSTLRRAYSSKIFMRDETTGKHRSVRYPFHKDEYYCEDPSICFEFGEILTLCKPETIFKTLGYNDDGVITVETEDYSIAEGGIYEIKTEFFNYPSLYFYKPIGKGIYYAQGPDLYMRYKHQITPNSSCNASSDYLITENNSLRGNELAVVGHSVFNESVESFSNSMISYDLNDIVSRWGGNGLYLGLTNASTIVKSENFLDLMNANSDCEFVEGDLETVYCTLQSDPQGWFEFSKNLDAQNSIPINEPVKIIVKAHFEDGFSIDKCIIHTFTESVNGLNLPLNSVRCSPSGRISEYLPNSTNYKIIIGQ